MDVKLSFTVTSLKVDVFVVTFNVDDNVVAPDTFNVPTDSNVEKTPEFLVFVPIDPINSFDVKVPVKLILPLLSIVVTFDVELLSVDKLLPIFI